MDRLVSVLAVIPARGGSKGIVHKNLMSVGGRPLVERAVSACVAARLVDRIVVTTDAPAIARVARIAGAEVIRRPDALSGDDATTESAVLHVLEVMEDDVDTVAIVQATSPFLDPSDLDAAIHGVQNDPGVDVMFSAVESHGFLWTTDGASLVGVNHAASRRLRRQDLPVQWLETGAFYVVGRHRFVESGHRFHGRIAPRPVGALHRFEVDDPVDLEICRALAPIADPLGCATLADRSIDAVVTDFDGVHTENRAQVDEHGTESVTVHRGDGMGLALLRAAGVPTLILSSEKNPVVARRAAKLDVECLFGVDDKVNALRAWAERRQLDLARVAYVGNDANDAECLAVVGHPIVVADAHASVRNLPGVVVTERAGGRGAIREIADAVLARSVPPASQPSPLGRDMSMIDQLQSRRNDEHVPH